MSAAGARVAIDYLPGATHAPGVGRYLRELARALAWIEERPALVLLELGRARARLPEAALGLAGAPRVERARWTVLGLSPPRRALAWAGRIGLDLARGAALVHGAQPPLVPAPRSRRTLAVAELPPAGAARRALASAARAADLVLVFSEAWRATAAAGLGLDPARVRAVRPGAEHWRRALARLPEPEAPPRILALGATRAAREPLAVLAAFERLRAGGIDARLTFAGRAADAERALGAACAASRWRADVQRIAAPEERELPALVAHASCLVHLECEPGTAVTPLEALALGCAVAASRTPVLEEALDGVAELIEPGADAAALATALERALASRGDPAAAERRRERAARYTWDRSAREHLALWSELAPELRSDGGCADSRARR